MLVYDETPSSVLLLLQCGYRSKVCTNHRATKLDGTLHKLCEFHRRKANLNQQKLHKRHREERSMNQKTELLDSRSVKKSRRNSQLSVEPIHHTDTDFQYQIGPVQTHLVDEHGISGLTSEEVAILEVLLLDTQPESPTSLKMFPLNSAGTTIDERNPIAASRRFVPLLWILQVESNEMDNICADEHPFHGGSQVLDGNCLEQRPAFTGSGSNETNCIVMLHHWCIQDQLLTTSKKRLTGPSPQRHNPAIAASTTTLPSRTSWWRQTNTQD